MNALTYSTAVATGRVRFANVRERSLLVARARLLIVLSLFACAALACLARIAYLGLDEPGASAASAHDLLSPARGEIVDRNGVPLARAFPAYALWYNPEALGSDTPLVNSPKEVARLLAEIFPDADEADLLRRLASKRPGYLRRRLLPDQANKVHALGEPALEFPREKDRYYPQGTLAAHVLGYVDSEGQGQVGMEQVLDSRLKDPAVRDKPHALSIDVRVQGALEDELGRGMLETKAIGAAGVVLDVHSGEILALASLPAFDPNRTDKAINSLVFNKVTNQVYELGSTFKPLAVAAAIDAGVVTNMGERFPAGPLRVGRFSIRDLGNKGPTVNVAQTLVSSSNVGTALMADRLGGVELKRYMAALGFNERPHIQLPARGFPIWPSGEWARLTTMTVSYGHGVAVTPLHLASAYAAMLNGGIWRPTTLEKVPPGQVVEGRRVFKPETSARMRQLVRMISLYGTGRNANAPGFRVGGKTGSAEKPGAGGYRRTSLVSTFAAAFPMDDPRFVIVAMMDEPQGTAASSYQRTAAWNAAPVVGRVVPRIGPLLGVYPDDNRDVDLQGLNSLVKGGH